MKNLFKLFGTQSLRLCAIALAAIIGFSFAACNMDGDDDGNSNNNNNNQQTQAPDVTFTLSDGTVGDNKFEVTVSGAEWNPVNANYIRIHFLFNENSSINPYIETPVTLSADKKTAVIAAYAISNGFGGSSLTEDETYTITFGVDADSLDYDAQGLLGITTVASNLEPDFWKTGTPNWKYQGTVTLVGESVSLTVKKDVFKPE